SVDLRLLVARTAGEIDRAESFLEAILRTEMPHIHPGSIGERPALQGRVVLPPCDRQRAGRPVAPCRGRPRQFPSTNRTRRVAVLPRESLGSRGSKPARSTLGSSCIAVPTRGNRVRGDGDRSAHITAQAAKGVAAETLEKAEEAGAQAAHLGEEVA